MTFIQLKEKYRKTDSFSIALNSRIIAASNLIISTNHSQTQLNLTQICLYKVKQVLSAVDSIKVGLSRSRKLLPN